MLSFFWNKPGLLDTLQISLSSTTLNSFIRQRSKTENGHFLLLDLLFLAVVCKIGHFSKTPIWFEGGRNLKSFCLGSCGSQP